MITVEFNQENKIVFLNDKKSGLEIVKVDHDSGEVLENATYLVTKVNGEIIGEYTTNSRGVININDLEPDFYEVIELKSPTNYLIDTTIHKVQIKENEVTNLKLTNKRLTGIQIIKTDSVTKQPLVGVKFRVKEVGGSVIGEYVTNEMGVIHVQNLKPSFYEISEISTLRDYILDTEPRIVEVTISDDVIVLFENTIKGGLQVKKVDVDTGEPLAGAKFRITRLDGTLIGEYTSSRTGFISIPYIDNCWVVIEEIQQPSGYILDQTPKTVEIRENKITIVEFSNKKLGGIQIIKKDALTGQPIAGAKFRVTTINGHVIGEYVTDSLGHINLPELQNGWYTCLEIEAGKRIYLR